MDRGWYARVGLVALLLVGSVLVVWPSLDAWLPAPAWLKDKISSRIAPGLDVKGGLRLTYEVGGQRYDAARVVRRDRHRRVSTKEARLAAADGRVLAGRATEMAPAVEQVLGLPFAHFFRCVVLPQGEFARFLHDRPADRQELLVSLLDLRVYERVAQEANRRAAAAEAAARLSDQHLDGLRGATPEAVAAGRERVAQRAELLG